MAQFGITKGPGTMDLMFALFDQQYPRTVKFTVNKDLYFQRDSTPPQDDTTYLEIEVVVTGVERPRRQGLSDTCWAVHGVTKDERSELVFCYYWATKRDGTMFIGEDAEQKRLFRIQHPELHYR